MTLAPGTRLGPYEIAAKVGEGGMGAVYKALDPRLGRSVAIKVLPEGLIATADQRARFDREARAISALSHPHICTLFDVGREGETDFLVMEYLEGETLADRLLKGRLPLDQAVRSGIEIAGALAQAHRLGLVHRDLKPANVLLTGSGVKLLDFGLAKRQAAPLQILSRSAVAAELTQVVSAEPLTVEGMLVGTPQYMSPEQIEAREADTRADLWAFGCVLYEMLSGRRAFSGDNPPAVIAAILQSEPERLAALAPSLPPALDRLVRSCLVKNRETRWQSAHDAALLLQEIARSGAEPTPPAPAGVRTRGARWPLLALGAAALLAGAGIAALLHRPAASAAAEVRLHIAPPQGEEFFSSFDSLSLAVSLDGRQLAFVTVGERAESRIWLRQIDEIEARPLPGTEGARSLIWSADGRSLAFFGGGKLKRLDLGTEAPVAICDTPSGTGFAGTWGAENQILFSGVQGDAIYSVSALGGTPEKIVEPDAQRNEARTKWPWFLGDGRRFVYLSRDTQLTSSLMLVEPGKPRRVVAPLESRVAFLAPDVMAFARDGVLVGQKFDPASARLLGAPYSIAPAVRFFFSPGWAGFAASPAGTAFLLSEDSVYRLRWMDRTGKPLGEVGPPGGYSSLDVSPDGHSVLVERMQPEVGSYDIWQIDLERGVETRLTSERGADIAGRWLPDGKSIVYSAQRPLGPNMVRRDLASGREQDLLSRSTFQVATSISRDGRRLLFRERGDDGKPRAWVLNLEGEMHPQQLFTTAGQEDQMRFAPDGDAFAYLSDETGAFEVYVSSLANRNEKVRISTGGASLVRWSRSGEEILYLTADRRMLAVPVRFSPRLELGLPVELFRLAEHAAWRDFDVSPDGSRILAIVRERSGGAQPATAILNWRPQEER
ncbi:MAG: protein kinase [Thermoanaerobaculia bacterium]